MKKENIDKDFMVVDIGALKVFRFVLSIIFVMVMIIPHLNYRKFGLDFSFMEFLHSHTNIALVCGMFLGSFITFLIAVNLMLKDYQ